MEQNGSALFDDSYHHMVRARIVYLHNGFGVMEAALKVVKSMPKLHRVFPSPICDIHFSRMRFTLATSMVALAILTAAAPQPTGQRIGVAIPITKRSGLVNADKTVNIDALKSHVASIKVYVACTVTVYSLKHLCFSKIHHGFANFEKNTGTMHPSAIKGVGKRRVGDTLTDNNNELWYGTISVGTPAKSFTGEFPFAP